MSIELCYLSEQYINFITHGIKLGIPVTSLAVLLSSLMSRVTFLCLSAVVDISKLDVCQSAGENFEAIGDVPKGACFHGNAAIT